MTVPGITAMSACAAAAGRPLAEGRDPLLVWPDAPPAVPAALLAIAPNVVFMKAARHLEALAAPPGASASAAAVAVRRCSLPERRPPATCVPGQQARLLHDRAIACGRRSVTFVGAGPGDPELITVKGRAPAARRPMSCSTPARWCPTRVARTGRATRAHATTAPACTWTSRSR